MVLLPTRLLVLAAVPFLALSAGCSSAGHDPEPPSRDCTSVVWVKTSHEGATVGLTGSWNGWQGVSVPTQSKDGWKYAYFQLPPGQYGYLVVEDGAARLDERNPLTTYRADGKEVSWLDVPDCSSPAVRIDEIASDAEGGAHIRATFLRGSSGAMLDPSSVMVTPVQPGRQVTVESASQNTGEIILRIPPQARGKTTALVVARDTSQVSAEEARVVQWSHAATTDWRDGLLYQIIVDRFRGDGGSPLSKPKTPGSRAGGTLDGVRSEIERGYFASLGVTALWLSPVVSNPVEAREGRGDGHLYEGYHGYWPLHSRQVDPHLGTSEDLRALIASAHDHGLRVILDVVPNHVYEKNPIYLQHRGDGWFHDGAGRCVCGDPGCGWDTHIETCWFTPYLPDYDWKNPAVADHVSEELRWWSDTYDLDGVRLDAVPMMPRSAGRRIMADQRSGEFPHDSRFMLGEVYTGPGEGGIKQIRYYLGPAGLDSAFDFPLMWAVWDVLARGNGGFGDIERVWTTTGVQFANSGAVIARMINNHDTKRFVSVANGDADGDPWSDPAKQPSTARPYEKLRMALALLLTSPGLPLIYYGDEVGVAGSGDPDCRRVMPRDSGLSTEQARVRDLVRRLGTFRACSRALRRGARVVLQANKDSYAYVRDAGDGAPVVVAMSKAAVVTKIGVAGNVLPSGEYIDVLDGEKISLTDQDATIQVAPWQVRVFVRGDDGCRRAGAQSQ